MTHSLIREGLEASTPEGVFGELPRTEGSNRRARPEIGDPRRRLNSRVGTRRQSAIRALAIGDAAGDPNYKQSLAGR
jgi:hypothetical protein